ncbi:LRR repeats and ubiquitin-like domain-containing protein [Apostasia shenzhenica]|uniref:LRR repeats and ubiquitin-like domain-containing protein n=1 Tax=Apostasia shenzhenica TaxID=1088818 RepID=A0A2I0AKW5_9ASPA|nr:LRR repeats and ubiquitin-like domain-containing protein [Apostasia shenzhenica]
MQANERREEAAADGAVITIHVKFGGQTFTLSLSPDCNCSELKALLQPLTNVLPRGQRLIFKGKVLADTASLRSVQLTNGSKVMLIASEGLHQGDGPVKKDAISVASILRKNPTSHQNQVNNAAITIEKTRAERWKLTGVAALSECHLKVVPDEVWNCGTSIRVLDLSSNWIQGLPSRIDCLKSLNKLYLNANDLSEERISWDGLSRLKSLTILSLNLNNLATLPSAVGDLISLRQLHIANNWLTCLPDELGRLNQLQILKAGNNRISLVTAGIGCCSSLIEIDLSSNHLVELPGTLGKLKNLKALYLSNNGLTSLPSTLFKMCKELSILDLRHTQLTNCVLRQIEGWAEFDERRRLKHQKQLDFRVGPSGVFDEGADDDHGQ